MRSLQFTQNIIHYNTKFWLFLNIIYCVLNILYHYCFDKHYNVVTTMSCLPPMTGNGKHTTYKNGDFGDGLP